MEHKFKKMKTCNNNRYFYCLQIIPNLNKKIILHNQKVKEEQLKKILQKEISEDILMKEAPKTEKEVGIRNVKAPDKIVLTKL